VVAVARHVPASGQTPARSWVREQWIYHAGMDGPGIAGPDTPLARRLDSDGDGIFEDTQFFLSDRQGSTLVITTHARDTSVPADGVFDRPGDILAKVTYTAFGEPIVHHPLDFDGDGTKNRDSQPDNDSVGVGSIVIPCTKKPLPSEGNDPDGIRTHVASVKGTCPGPG
jgi:hypothetical protein